MSQFHHSESLAEALAGAIDRFSDVDVVVVGDIILDRYIDGSVDRISPEAPVPVVLKSGERMMLGGAGNVATNLLAYGANVSLIGLTGDDDGADRLEALCAEQAGLVAMLVRDQSRVTSTKTRIVVKAQQMVRLDHEVSLPVSPEMEDALVAAVEKRLAAAQVVILSDYAKGVLTGKVCRRIISAARAADTRILVDPKRRDLGAYEGADLISPNLRELEMITGRSARNDSDAGAACSALLESVDLGAVLLTRGEAGMTLQERGTAAHHFPAEARSVYDVSGAGDTVIATLAAGIAAGLSLPEAARLGNTAAGLVVAKAGTSTISVPELRHALGIDAPNRPVSIERAKAIVDGLREGGQKIGFTNGCFDLLHRGHLHSLEQAHMACDVLVVGLNSDRSVRALKGEGRPVQDEQTRAAVMAGLTVCDLVVIFDNDTPLELIKALRPDILFKGADYIDKPVVGQDVVEAHGGRVQLLSLVDGVSTTRTVERLKANAQRTSETGKRA